MGPLIRFEIKKAVKSRKNRIVLVIYCILIASMIFTKIDEGARQRTENISNFLFLEDYYKLDHATYGNRAEQLDAPLFKIYSDNAAIRAEYYGLKAKTMLERDVYAELNADIKHYENELKFYTEDVRELLDSGELLKGLPSRYMDYPSRLLSSPDMRKNTVDYYRLQHEFLTSLRDNNIRPMNRYDITGFAFLYSAFNELLPPIALLIALLVLSDIMSGEADSGSLKFLLLQPLPRGKVVLAKTIAAFIITLMWLLIPLFVAFLILGLIKGFGNPNYPVLYLKGSFASLKSPPTAPNYDGAYLSRSFFRTVSWERDTAFLGAEYRHGHFYLGYSKYASEYGYFLNYALPNKELVLIPIAVFLLRCLIPISLFALFAAALAVFVSILTRKGVISIVVGTLTGVMFTIFTIQPERLNLLKILNPLAYKNPIALLSGIGGVTSLLGACVLFLFSVLLFALAHAIFNKRDVIC